MHHMNAHKRQLVSWPTQEWIVEAGTETPGEQNERNSHMHSGLQQGNKFQGEIY